MVSKIFRAIALAWHALCAWAMWMLWTFDFRGGGETVDGVVLGVFAVFLLFVWALGAKILGSLVDLTRRA